MEGSSSLYVVVFNLSLELRQPHVQRVVWHNGLKFLVVRHHLAKGGGIRPCGSSDTGAKMLSLSLQDYVIKGSGDFMEGSCLLLSTHYIICLLYLHTAKN